MGGGGDGGGEGGGGEGEAVAVETASVGAGIVREATVAVEQLPLECGQVCERIISFLL